MGAYQVIWICDSVTQAAIPELPAGWEVEFVRPQEALSNPSAGVCSAVILDCPIVGWPAGILIEEIRRRMPFAPILVRDSEVSPAAAVRLAHLGVHQLLPTGGDPFPEIEVAVEEHRRTDLNSGSGKEPAPWE